MSEPQKQDEAEGLVAALADPARREAAFRDLLALGGPARPAIRAGLGDGRWEVRRLCALWLMRFPEPDDLPRLVPLLRDPRSKVRHAAVVAVGCARAADPGDVVPFLVERALQDDSVRVRRQAVSMLAWRHAHPDLEGFFAGLLESERDPKLHRWAGIGRFFCRARAAQRAAKEESC